MNESGKKRTTAADKMVNLVIAVVIVVFVVAGAYATYGKIAEGIKDKAIANGEAEPTVAYLAKQSSMTAEDYLAQYGLTLGDAVSESTTQSDMIDNMTIENYAKYNGQEADELMQGMGEAVTKDTLWKDLMAMPASQVLNADAYAQVKEQYQMDDLTDETTYEDFQSKLYEKALEAQQAQTQGAAEAPAAE